MSFLANLNKRYAIKKYNGKEVEQSALEQILEAIRMAPSSNGTQPYHIVVTNGEVKNKLIESSGQTLKIDASHLLVFCTRVDYKDRIEKQISINAELQGKKVEELSGLQKSVESSWYSHVEAGDVRAWAGRQAYIALGFALAACAELSVDSSPMEGFSPIEFKKILGLPDYIDPVAILALGYRDPDNEYLKRPKMRFPSSDLFEFK